MTLEQWNEQFRQFCDTKWAEIKQEHRLDKRYDEDYEEHLLQALNELDDAKQKWLVEHPSPLTGK